MSTGPRIVLHLTPLPAVPGEPDAMVRLRTILKKLLRAHGWRCTAAMLDGAQDLADVLDLAETSAEPSAVPDAGDVAQLQEIIRGLTDRVAAQAELLARWAEK